MASYLNKAEVVELEINIYLKTINSNEKSNETVLRLFEFHSRLKTEYDEKRKESEISSGFDNLINRSKY